MMSWLNAMGVHDFTGERAAAQWETWQEEKRQAQKGTQGSTSGFFEVLFGTRFLCGFRGPA